MPLGKRKIQPQKRKPFVHFTIFASGKTKAVSDEEHKAEMLVVFSENTKQAVANVGA